MPDLTLTIPEDKVQESAAEAQALLLKDLFAPPGSYKPAGAGWTELEAAIREHARQVISKMDLRPLVEEAVAQLAPSVIGAEVHTAIAKAAKRALTERPGLVLEKVKEVLG